MKKIGMIIPDGTNQYFSSLAQNFQKELAKQKSTLIVVDSSNSKAHENSNIELFDSIDIQGLIFISVGDNGEAYLKLNSLRIPLLILDREIPNGNADFLMNDDSYGIKDGLRYLTSLNHKSIAFITGDLDTEPGRVRLESYKEWFDENNDFELFEDLIFEGDFMIGTGITVANKIIELDIKNRPTAIFASNDIMAIGLLFELQKNGFNVPRDFSILGYDDILFSSWIYPKLSTIKQDIVDIARTGVELLINRIDGRHKNKKIKIINPSLVTRESTLKL